jgi:hypothetical protein
LETYWWSYSYSRASEKQLSPEQNLIPFILRHRHYLYQNLNPPVKTSKRQEDENKRQETPDGKEQEDPNKVKNTSIKVLHLAGNGLGDVFIQSILGIFGKHSALEDLNRFGNRITDFGLNLIVDKLPQLQHLKCPWVGHNSFSIAAGKDLIDVMRTNYTLEDVNLRSMDDGTEALQKDIELYSRLNRGGRRIHGSKNKGQTPLSLWPLVLEHANRVH